MLTIIYFITKIHKSQSQNALIYKVKIKFGGNAQKNVLKFVQNDETTRANFAISARKAKRERELARRYSPSAIDMC